MRLSHDSLFPKTLSVPLSVNPCSLDISREHLYLSKYLSVSHKNHTQISFRSETNKLAMKQLHVDVLKEKT